MSGDGKAYYGYLFEADKKPTKVLDALLRGIADHISQNLGNKEEKNLVPEKLAAFYKAVGGNYDSLFVDSIPVSISWIYSSIGCQHTLQPTLSDYEPPSIPALTPAGFVRWQSIELLLGPEEHVPFIQTAVKEFHLKHPETGLPFPLDLPAEAFPLVADKDIGEWHKQCAKTLSEKAARAEVRPDLPPRPSMHTTYTHVRPTPRVSRHNTDAPRSRPDSPYFDPRGSLNIRPIYQHVQRPVRPGLVATPSHRAHQFLAPEDLNPRVVRTRRRSYPENMASPTSETPSAVQPPEPARHGDRDHVRRHSHPRHARRGSVSSDASDSSAGSISPKMRKTRRPLSGEKPMPIPPGVRYVPPTPDVRSRTLHRDREREREEDVKRRSFPTGIAADLSGKLSAPFMFGRKERERERVHRSTSRSGGGGGLKWRDLDGVGADEVWRRGSTEEDERDSPRPRTAGAAGLKREKSAREGSDRTGSEREAGRKRRERDGGERERPKTSDSRERDRERRDRERERDGGLEQRPVTRGASGERGYRERERERERDREREPIRGVDGRRYPSHHG